MAAMQLVLVDGASGRMVSLPVPEGTSPAEAVNLAVSSAEDWAAVDYASVDSVEFAFQLSEPAQDDPSSFLPTRAGVVKVSGAEAALETKSPDFDLGEYLSAAEQRGFDVSGRIVEPDALEAVLVAPLSPAVAAASLEGAEAAEVSDDSQSREPRRQKLGAAATRQRAAGRERSVEGYFYERKIDPPTR